MSPRTLRNAICMRKPPNRSLRIDLRHIYQAFSTSSVARGARGGGGSRPPHWPIKYAKSHVLGAFEADFRRKNENSPPPKKIGCRSCEVDVVIRPEKAFDFPILAEKSVSISVKTFFILEINWFWAEKAFEFPSFPRNSVSIFE